MDSYFVAKYWWNFGLIILVLCCFQQSLSLSNLVVTLQLVISWKVTEANRIQVSSILHAIYYAPNNARFDVASFWYKYALFVFNYTLLLTAHNWPNGLDFSGLVLKAS